MTVLFGRIIKGDPPPCVVRISGEPPIPIPNRSGEPSVGGGAGGSPTLGILNTMCRSTAAVPTDDDQTTDGVLEVDVAIPSACELYNPFKNVCCGVVTISPAATVRAPFAPDSRMTDTK